MSDFLNMSDEDFLKSARPPEVTQEDRAVVQEEVRVPDPVVETPTTEEVPAEVVTSTEEQVSEVIEQPAVEEPTKVETPAAEVTEPTKVETTPAVETQESTVDYKAAYEKVMAPFKANGKTIQMNNPDEVIQLMQMGANYTRNMQQLAPHRKLLLMLDKAGITESNIGLLLDVHAKNPEAIKKVMKDAGMDPLDMDLSQEPQYQAGNHQVTDTEVAFRQVLEDVKSSPEGQETLVHIDRDWDQTSKELLVQNPDVLQTIQEQRVNGIYGRIDAEVQRQRLLGNIPATTPYLAAYKQVGDYLAQNGGFADLVQPVQQATKPAPIATTVKKVEPAVQHNAEVAAAAVSRTTPVAAKTAPNFLAMSDEDFMKHHANFQGRL